MAEAILTCTGETGHQDKHSKHHSPHLTQETEAVSLLSVWCVAQLCVKAAMSSRDRKPEALCPGSLRDVKPHTATLPSSHRTSSSIQNKRLWKTLCLLKESLSAIKPSTLGNCWIYHWYCLLSSNTFYQKFDDESCLDSFAHSPISNKRKKSGINGFNNGKLPNTHYKLQLLKKEESTRKIYICFTSHLDFQGVKIASS